MKLKDLIYKLDIPITQFSKEVGLSRRTIYDLLQEKFQPRVVTIKKICKYFKVDFKDYV